MSTLARRNVCFPSTKPLTLATVIRNGTVFIQWPEGESMVNVNQAMERGNEYGVVFDPEDPDLWEYPEGGYRLHGMFIDAIVGRGLSSGIGACG